MKHAGPGAFLAPALLLLMVFLCTLGISVAAPQDQGAAPQEDPGTAAKGDSGTVPSDLDSEGPAEEAKKPEVEAEVKAQVKPAEDQEKQ